MTTFSSAIIPTHLNLFRVSLHSTMRVRIDLGKSILELRSELQSSGPRLPPPRQPQTVLRYDLHKNVPVSAESHSASSLLYDTSHTVGGDIGIVYKMGEQGPGVGFEFPTFEVSWVKRDLLLFAASIGATYPDELHFLYVRYISN